MKKLVAILGCALIAATTAVAGEYPDLSIKELKEKIKAKEVVLLDVNGSKTYEKGHIPGAIDFRANSDKLAELLPEDKDTLVVAYCGGPSCKAYQAGAKAAEELGYTNIAHLSAGISGWLQAGEETEKPSKKAAKKSKG